MKKTISTAVFILISLIAFTQKVSQLEEYKCSHGKINHLKSSTAYNQAMDNYDVKFYFIDLNVSNTSVFISGNTLIQAQAVNLIDTFFIQLDDSMIVDSVLFNNINTAFQHSNNELSVIVGSIPASTLFTIQVFYSGTSTGGGLSSDNWWGWVPNTTWSLSESFHAKEWFPCKEVLSDKADSVYVFVTVDNNLKAGSNGLLAAVTPVDSAHSRYEWKTYYPINYYLISIAVAPYVEYNFYAYPAGLNDSVFVQNYVYDTTANNLSDIQQTADLIVLFSDLLGMYPFANEKYGHCQAPLGGAMEHQTMTTTGYLDFWIIAHELGHQWFGDNVTCATWQDIWINEGFASYTEYLALQYLKTQTEADTWMNDAHDFALNELTGSVYIPVTDATNETRIFSKNLSYKKGAAIVHTIRFIIDNDSLFFNVLRNFQNTYKDSVATGADFRDFLFAETNIDFIDFFDQWYYGQGFPYYDVFWNFVNDTLTIDVNQTTSSLVTPFFGNDMEYKIIFQNGTDTLVRVAQNQNTEQYQFVFTNYVADIVIDPNNWILNGYSPVISKPEYTSIKKQIDIYPNPFNDKTTITLNDNYINATIDVYDLSGRKIYNDSFSGNKYILQIDNLEKGSYIVNIATGNRLFSGKIFKQ